MIFKGTSFWGTRNWKDSEVSGVKLFVPVGQRFVSEFVQAFHGVSMAFQII